MKSDTELADCLPLKPSDFESMVLESRLEFYVMHIAEVPRLCDADRERFMAQRMVDLRKITPRQRAAHLAREKQARATFRAAQAQYAWLERCGEQDVAWFDPAPEHPWNQLYWHFFVRQDSKGCYHGWDKIDPYLFEDTRGFLKGAGHEARLAILRQFIEYQYDSLITEPRLRALMQRDLLAVLHWTLNRKDRNATVAPEARDLASALIPVIRSLALPEAGIMSLPDNLEQVMPVSRLQRFMVVSARDQAAANVHLRSFFHGSAFVTLIALPGGPGSTTAYLSQLESFRPRMVKASGAGSGVTIRNPMTPQFPEGTEFLLERRAILWSREGRPVISPLVEAIQGRTYNVVGHTRLSPDMGQTAFSMELSHELFFMEHEGGLRAHDDSDVDFSRFLETSDPMESVEAPKAVLGSCLRCHAQNDFDGNKIGSGIHSVHTYDRTIQSTGIPADIVHRGRPFEYAQIQSQLKSVPSWRALGTN